jgi:hypothetical protein
MTQAIVLRETGGPEKLQYETVEVAAVLYRWRDGLYGRDHHVT